MRRPSVGGHGSAGTMISGRPDMNSMVSANEYSSRQIARGRQIMADDAEIDDARPLRHQIRRMSRNAAPLGVEAMLATQLIKQRAQRSDVLVEFLLDAPLERLHLFSRQQAEFGGLQTVRLQQAGFADMQHGQPCVMADREVRRQSQPGHADVPNGAGAST